MDLDRREPSEAANAPQEAEAPCVAAGPSLGRALERYALRDLKVRRREEYRRQDAEDAAYIDGLRHQRNERVDALDQRAWDLRVAYELALASQRQPWIDAREESMVAKRSAKQALAAARQTHNPRDRAAIEKMRVAHRSAQDAFGQESRALDLNRELAICALRERWNDARGRTADAKRAVADVRERFANSRDKDRSARVKAQAQSYQGLLTSSQIAWEAVRRTSIDRAKAAALVQAAIAEGRSQEAVEALRSQEAALQARQEQLQLKAQEADAAVAASLIAAERDTSPDGVLAEGALQAALVEARDEEATEKRRAQRAVDAYRTRTRADERRAFDDLRTRRNAESDSYTEAVRRVYVARGEREADLRSDYLDKRHQEHAARTQAKEENRAYRKQKRPAHASALEYLRMQKNVEHEQFFSAVNTINKQRGMERAEERAEVRALVQQVLLSFEGEGCPGSPAAAQTPYPRP